MAIANDTMIRVVNRDNGIVGYTIPEMGNLTRNFKPGEPKEVTMEELRKLSYISGGDVLLRDMLVITNNDEAVRELMGDVEPEYKYNEKDVENLLLNGTKDQLLDCLDFAPQGVVDLVKDKAVEMKIADINKRNAIKEKTGFDVTKAIEINELTAEPKEEKPKERRSEAVKASETPTRGRRATALKTIEE